jgi:hypothetical protein
MSGPIAKLLVVVQFWQGFVEVTVRQQAKLQTGIARGPKVDRAIANVQSLFWAAVQNFEASSNAPFQPGKSDIDVLSPTSGRAKPF